MNILKQSTAATIKLGPFIDDTDGKTAETALTISQADIRLSKNGGDIAQTNNSAGATHDELGYYNVPLDTTDTNTLGRLLVAVHESGALPVWQDFLVVTANVYDTLCSTDSLDVNVTALADDVITAGKFDESTAYPLKSADTGITQVARVGADSDTLETLSDQLDVVQTDLDNPAQYKADVSGLALEATLTAIKGAGWTTETLVALDALIDAIKAKTDLMNASAITYTSNVDGTAITLLRGDTFTASITNVGALTDYVSIDFTVKASKSDADDDAIIRIRKNASGVGDGLLRLNGAAPTTETGTITIDDLASGDITITIDETATDGLSSKTYVYDLQLITATSVSTLTSGKLTVTLDVTRAIV